jgi:Fusaric acid resistance protein-like
MTRISVSPRSTPSRAWLKISGWIRAKDPARLAVKRSARAAVTMPAAFGLTHALFSNPQVSLFGAFGSFAFLLLVDFPGRSRVRLVSYVALVVAGGCLITVGTVVSTHKVAAIVVMALVGFSVLFAGIASPNIATASTATLLLFVLPVAVAQPAGAVGPRLLGWAFASAFSIPACMCVWPTPWHDNLRRRLAATVSAVKRVAEAHADGRRDPAAQAALQSELSLLRIQFSSTPYPPTGASAGTVALAKLVGRVEWVASNPALVDEEPTWSAVSPVRGLIEAVAETLGGSAALICDGDGHPVTDRTLVEALQIAIRRLDQSMGVELDAEVSMLIEPAPTPSIRTGLPSPEGGERGIASSLDPSFQARGLGIATEMLADAALEAAGAQAVGDRRLGTSAEVPSLVLWRRLVSYLSFHSVWFRNAVRGGAGLALAVAVVEVTDVEHGFWVVLGTLSVLRSNALGTGATAVRAVAGTTVGFVVGSVITIGVGGHPVALWVLLPLAVLVSGAAPAMISFAAGQAGFTLVVIILFNIIEPTGWKVGLTRIEDVAIGCGVSIVVGLLFWPRGATAALGRALSEAFVTSSGYLADAVDRLTATSRLVDTEPARQASHGAYLRLDDAFRQFLGERGAKVMSVDVVAGLLTGSNRIRLAAFTLAALKPLPPQPGEPELESVAIAGAVLRDSYAESHRWYEEFGELLAGRRTTLGPLPAHNEALHGILRRAFDDVRARRRSDRLRTMLQMLWADDLLEAQRQVQSDLAGSADLFVSRRQKNFMI